MSLANPLEWVITNAYGDDYAAVFDSWPRFAKPTDPDGFWNPTGGDGAGAFVSPFDFEGTYVWLVWVGGYGPQQFYKRIPFEGTVNDGGWSAGQYGYTEAVLYGTLIAPEDSSSPYTGEIYGEVDDQAIDANLWVGPIMPGSFRIHDFNEIAFQDDGEGNIVALRGTGVTGSGAIDYETGAISLSFDATNWGASPSVLVEGGVCYTRPMFYGSGPSRGESVPTPEALPSSIIVNWRRLNTPAEGAPITLRYFALDEAPEGLATFSDLEPTSIELPDSEGAESGSYELTIPSGTQIFALSLIGLSGCVGETDIEFWFTHAESIPSTEGPVLGVGIASTIQELLQD